MREHVTNGYDCWCEPRFMLPCDDCEAGCWKCADGANELTREQAEETYDAIVIVHNDEEP